MTDQYERPYFDSSIFIAWIKGEVIGGIDRKAVANHNFTLASRGAFKIFTSAVTLAEVHRIKGRPGTLSASQDEEILQFFEHEYIIIVDVDREVGENANKFCREYGLNPMDAIHLACALRAKCDVLLSWDNDYKGVRRTDIRCERPQMLGQLELALSDSGAATRPPEGGPSS
jgi:predicted nucleic acid-binding protein